MTARDIVSAIHTGSDRAFDYSIGEPVDFGGEYATEPEVTVTAGGETLVIAANYDRATGEHVGYTWSTYAGEPEPENLIATDGTDDAEQARAAVEAFIDQAGT